MYIRSCISAAVVVRGEAAERRMQLVISSACCGVLGWRGEKLLRATLGPPEIPPPTDCRRDGSWADATAPAIRSFLQESNHSAAPFALGWITSDRHLVHCTSQQVFRPSTGPALFLGMDSLASRIARSLTSAMAFPYPSLSLRPGPGPALKLGVACLALCNFFSWTPGFSQHLMSDHADPFHRSSPQRVGGFAGVGGAWARAQARAWAGVGVKKGKEGMKCGLMRISGGYFV